MLGTSIYEMTAAQLESEALGWDGYPDAAWEKPSLAVVASDGDGYGAVIHTSGPHLRYQIDEVGFHELELLGLHDCPAGVWVWAGKIRYQGCGPDTEPVTEGEYRHPTEEEWQAIRDNVPPWDDRLWRAK